MQFKFHSTAIALATTLFLFSSCSKSDDTTTTTNNNGGGGTGSLTVDSPTQFKATIDGSAVSAIADGSAIEEVFSNDHVVIGTNGNPSSTRYLTSIYNNNTSQDIFTLKKGTLQHQSGMIAQDTSFKSFFKVASSSYSPDAMNGVQIVWTDGSGTKWATDLGSANQTGSAFSIKSNKEYNFGYQQMRIVADFNCKLYNAGGQSKTLTGGTVVMSFENE